MPCDGVCAGANPVGHPNFDGPKMIGYPPPYGGRTVRGESLGGPGSIPGMECLRSITSLAHLILRNVIKTFPQTNRVREVASAASRIFP